MPLLFVQRLWLCSACSFPHNQCAASFPCYPQGAAGLELSHAPVINPAALPGLPPLEGARVQQAGHLEPAGARPAHTLPAGPAALAHLAAQAAQRQGGLPPQQPQQPQQQQQQQQQREQETLAPRPTQQWMSCCTWNS